MKHERARILYVDDDVDDAEFLSEALRQVNPEVDLNIAENGLKALQYLQKLKDANNKLPCLIILDLNMPYLDGKQTFKRIKEDPELQQVPIIIYTSSRNPQDETMFSSLGIEFITKPHNLMGLHDVASRLLESC